MLNFDQVDVPAWIRHWATAILSHPFREQACQESQVALIEQLFNAMLRGDSCIPVHHHQQQQLEHLVVHAKQAPEQVAPFVFDDQYLYLYRYWILEHQLAKKVQQLQQQEVTKINTVDYQNLFTDQLQQQALDRVAQYALSIITGGPGTGKTYTLARIIAALGESIENLRIAMAAPTGKAAQRMEEALMASFQDPILKDFKILQHKPKPVTLHRLLGLGHQHKPRFHAHQPLPYDLIVIDEASMLDLQLATLLFDAVPENARLILLGDAHQLTSVDVGSVLADLQQVEKLAKHRVNLLTTRRFTEHSLIKKMADFIQNNTTSSEQALTELSEKIVTASQLKPLDLTASTDQLQLEYLQPNQAPNELYDRLYFGYQPYVSALKNYLAQPHQEETMQNVLCAFDQYRILTATRHGLFGVKQLNQQIEYRLLQDLNMTKQGEWYVGRPVMMTYNDYQIGLSNGDIGICLQRDQYFEVYFPSLNQWIPATRLPKEIQTAFNLTIHKSQGSEFTHTAVVLDQSAEKLLSKELLYTAITRAKQAISLLADEKALATALTVRSRRTSGLLKKINNPNVSIA